MATERGPGSYDHSRRYATITIDKLHHSFGTNCERPEFKEDGEIQTQLGPGSYYPKHDPTISISG